MVYSYRNDQATVIYDSFRQRAREDTTNTDEEAAYVDSNVPCMLHPVKANRNVQKAAADGNSLSAESKQVKETTPLQDSA